MRPPLLAESLLYTLTLANRYNMYMYTHTNTCAHMHPCTHTHTHTHTHIYTTTHTMYTHASMRVHTHARTHTHTHAHTHTHTHKSYISVGQWLCSSSGSWWIPAGDRWGQWTAAHHILSVDKRLHWIKRLPLNYLCSIPHQFNYLCSYHLKPRLAYMCQSLTSTFQDPCGCTILDMPESSKLTKQTDQQAN